MAARALWIGVAADDELLAAMALDLDPVARAAARIRAACPLGHDTLETLLIGRLQEGLPVADHVVDIADGPERRHEEPETIFSRGQWEAAQVVAVEIQAVEEHAFDRDARGGALDVPRIGQAHARLEGRGGGMADPGVSPRGSPPRRPPS